MKTISIFLLLFCMCLVGCTSGGHSTYRRSTADYVDDQLLASKIKGSLYKDEVVEGTDVQVETHRGVVILSGFVDSAEQRQRAEELTRKIPGVSALKNSILLKGQVPIEPVS